VLKTALKPKWIAALVLALAISGVFVLLSQWQFSRSVADDAPPPTVTEKVKPLLDTFAPGQPLLGEDEGQMVTVTGHFDPTKQVIVQSRVEKGKTGFWVVTAFVVDGAPKLKGVGATDTIVIPVARGWIAHPDEGSAPPSGTIDVTGRLLNAEGPIQSNNVPAGQVTALSTAELTNIWQTTTYAAFIVSDSELANGVSVGAHAGDGNLVPITVTATDQDNKINWLNIFYAIEWVVFAGFAVFMWWRLLADEYRRGLDDEDDEYDDGDPTLGAGPDGPADGYEPDHEPAGAPATQISKEVAQ
jgi:cytochrome oxidase assembly protein ShyY1